MSMLRQACLVRIEHTERLYYETLQWNSNFRFITLLQRSPFPLDCAATNIMNVNKENYHLNRKLQFHLRYNKPIRIEYR